MRKLAFRICENKGADQLQGYRAADQQLCFRYLLNPKFQASRYLPRLYSPVCVRPVRKLRRQVFSRRNSNNKSFCLMTQTLTETVTRGLITHCPWDIGAS